MADSGGNKKKRGPYKLYLTPSEDGYSSVVPRTTKWRRLNAVEQHELSLSQESHGHFDFNINEEEGDENITCTQQPEENEGHAAHDDSYHLQFSEDDDLFQGCQEGMIPDHESTNTDSADDILDDIHDEDASQDQNPHHVHENHSNDEQQTDEDSPLYENASLTVGQCLLLIMAFILGNKLTGVAVGNLLRLLALILPSGSRLPQTKFLFDKYFNVFKEGLEFKLFCPFCKSLLETCDNIQCSLCEKNYDKQKLLEAGNFFIYLPLEKQLLDLFQRQGSGLNLDYRFSREKQSPDSIEDIYDGQMYKSIANGELLTDPNSLSLSFNCDGVPVFRSSSYSIWPLQGIVNELPPQQRKQNIFLLGLWFGTGKPSMMEFLHPFTKELRKLSDRGMKWLRCGREVCSKVFACICSCDSVARCVLQNIHQFNGQYGCSWCYNPGTTVEKGRGHSRVYLESPHGYGIRTHEEMVRNARAAYRANETVLGVKGPSKLLELPYFDTVRGFVVDNLHCVDLGVSRQLSHLWFDSNNHHEAWYLGRHQQEIDDRLSSIMPPHEVTRIPRSISQRAYWKGSEWHWWLLLYCPVVLSGLLPSPYFRHLLLLVEAVYLLSKSSISRADINKADACLSKFVRNFQCLYGHSHMTYNVHQLRHLTQTVIDWGPLSGYSTYIFEGFNQVLLKLFHGTRAVPSQIAKSFLLYRALHSISNVSTNDDVINIIFSYLDVQLKGHARLKKAKKMGENVSLLGASYFRQLGIEEKYLVEEYQRNDDIQDEAEFFTKAVVDGNVIHCCNYTRKCRRKNYIVGTSDGRTVELVVFTAVKSGEDECKSIAFARSIKTEQLSLYPDSECGHLCSHIRKVFEIESALEVVDLSEISDKFALIDCEGGLGMFVCKLPNILDRD